MHKVKEITSIFKIFYFAEITFCLVVFTLKISEFKYVKQTILMVLISDAFCEKNTSYFVKFCGEKLH